MLLTLTASVSAGMSSGTGLIVARMTGLFDFGLWLVADNSASTFSR